MDIIYMGGILFIIGAIFKLLPPKKKNWIYGWRTSFAMKNDDTWKEAQSYGANLFILAGLALAALGYLIYVFYPNSSKDMGFFIFIALIVVIIAGEVHLRRLFDEKGNRK